MEALAHDLRQRQDAAPLAQRNLVGTRFLARLQRGEEGAFALLYERHHGELLRYCGGLLRSFPEAEEAVQQTFVSAYGALRREARPDQLRPWLYAIARNRCIAMLKARREQPSGLPDRVAVDTLATIELREGLQELVSDVAKLPKRQEAALVLSEVGGFSHAEIAEVLGCQRSKVKALVFHARAALKHRREARETPCDLIREQLATLRRGALRRTPLRFHLETCPSCADFREEMRRERRGLAAIPLAPLAALKKLLGAAGGSSTLSAGSLAVKAGVAVVAATVVAVPVVDLPSNRAADRTYPLAGEGGVPALIAPTPEAEIPALAQSPLQLVFGGGPGEREPALEGRPAPSEAEGPGAAGESPREPEAAERIGDGTSGIAEGPQPAEAGLDPVAPNTGEGQRGGNDEAGRPAAPGPRTAPGRARGEGRDGSRGAVDPGGPKPPEARALWLPPAPADPGSPPAAEHGPRLPEHAKSRAEPPPDQASRRP